MATYTDNYNLKKPDPTDFVEVSDLNENMDIIDGELKKRASLDSSGKVPAEQLPAMDYIPTAQRGAANGVATLAANGKVPSGQLPAMDYIPTSQKGAVNGVASLGADSKVLTSQLPAMDYIPTSQKGAANGVASLGADGKILPSQLGAAGVPPQIIVTVQSGSSVTCANGGTTVTKASSGVVTFDLPNYGAWSITATLNGQTTSETVLVDDVKQYAITLSYFSATLRVTSESGATVTATGPKTYSATVPSSGVVDIAIKAAGTYTIRASKNGETTDAVTRNIATHGNLYTCECLFFNSVLANNTWAQIAEASAAGKASQLWNVGDTKDIIVSGEALTLEIVGFNHDDLPGGGKAGITFGLKHLMANTRKMDSSSTNENGFTGTTMYTWLQNTLLPSLPSDLQDVIKMVNKKTSAGDCSSAINTNAMKLFLFSEIEIFGSIEYSVNGEGAQYSRFATTASRIKYLANGTGGANNWWERSPDANDPDYFCNVTAPCDADSNSPTTAKGVCFGFCV